MGERGQEALLRGPARVLGLPVTAAYLAAGGTPVDTDELGGFFAGDGVTEFNPDAGPSPRDARAEPGVIARIPHAFSTDRAVAVGAHGVAFRAGGCPACFARTVEALDVGTPGVAIEALAALAWQRIVLGLADSLGVLRLDGGAASVRRCEAHG